MAPAGNAKSRPGITPCGLIRDCWFPSSVAVMISGGERKGSGLLRKYSVRDIQAEATTNHLVNGVARGSRPSHHYGMEALNGPSGHGAWIVIGSAQPIYALKGKTNSKFGATVMALRVIDSLVLRSEPLILLLGRVCIGSLYLMSGINHWLDLTLLTHFMAGLPGSANLWAMLVRLRAGSRWSSASGPATSPCSWCCSISVRRRSAIPTGRLLATPPHAGPNSSISGRTSGLSAVPSSSSREARDP
jgi:hypothetical protein